MERPTWAIEWAKNNGNRSSRVESTTLHSWIAHIEAENATLHAELVGANDGIQALHEVNSIYQERLTESLKALELCRERHKQLSTLHRQMAAVMHREADAANVERRQ